MRFRAVPRLPPGARSPRSAPRAAGGVARCCLALWSSEQVDRHLLPRVALGVALGCREREPPPPPICMDVPGLLVVKVQCPGGLGKLALPEPTEVILGAPAF